MLTGLLGHVLEGNHHRHQVLLLLPLVENVARKSESTERVTVVVLETVYGPGLWTAQVG